MLTLASVSGCAIASLGGCEVDSYLDGSHVGRFENTPTTVPILTEISSIEDKPIELVKLSQIQPADLIPEAEEYTFVAGDQMEIRIRDFFLLGQEDLFQITVDALGYIEIPKLRPIFVQGKTKPEITTKIQQEIQAAQFNANAVVSVTLLSQRKSTFSVLGAAAQPGSYFIPAPDYRLLEGVTAAGGIDENVKFVYIIRQVPLTQAAASGPRRSSDGAPEIEPAWRPTPPTDYAPTGKPEQGEKLIDLIDELSGEKKPSQSRPDATQTPPPQPPPSPAILNRRQPESGMDGAKKTKPPIDLPGLGTMRPAERAPDQFQEQAVGGFVFRDGKWMRRGFEQLPQSTPMLTQRVIQVPVDKLLAGVADVNIVLRPGDVVRVPPNRAGLVYMAGQVSRPGPFNLPNDGGRLSLSRAITSAGGLSSIAIPERCDLTRMVGDERQATIRVNLKAIFEGTQPDIFLKPDDHINVGTNFFAFPLAVIRNGFRSSYGFGFLLDRNFGNDVFGAPPGETNN